MGVGRVWRVLWGTNNENQLDFNWPTAVDEPVFWREPRAASERVIVNNIQESWITGRNYYGKLKARWFGMPQWSGSNGLQAFFDNAGDSNPFTLVPDSVFAPNFQIPGCYLEDPFDKPAPTLEPDGTQSIDFTFWNPAYDLGLAFRDLMFEYEPGADITQPLAYTFTRTGIGWFLGVNGLWQQAAAGVLRDRHYDNAADFGTGGTRVTLLEKSATNIVWNNRDLTVGTGGQPWNKTSVTAAKDQVGIDGVANSASSIVATAANGTCLQPITLAASFRSTSCFVKRLVGSGTIQMTTDNTTFTTITVTSNWTRVKIPSQNVTNPNIGFKIVTSGDKIAVDFVQSEVMNTSANPPTSPIQTAGANVTRQADALSAPWNYNFQPMFYYAKFIETGDVYEASGQPRNFGISSFGNNPRFLITSTGTNQYNFFYVDASGASFSVSPSITINGGDVVEILFYIDGFGNIGGQIATNGGAPVTVGPTATSGAPPNIPFPTPVIGLASENGGAQSNVEFITVRLGPFSRPDGTSVNTIALARAA